MKLNHINLPVGDVGATKDFFAQYFGMKVEFELPKNVMAMLRDDAGLLLIVSHFRKGEAGDVPYHPDFHVGFLVDSNDEVDATRARLVAGGLDVEAPKRRQGGRYGFYYPAPGGFVLEVECLNAGPRPQPAPAPAGELASGG